MLHFRHFSLPLECACLKCFHRLQTLSPIHLQLRKPHVMHLLASLTEQENVKSFPCDHISPWPLHHMVEKAGSCSPLPSVPARSSGCESVRSAWGLGRWRVSGWKQSPGRGNPWASLASGDPPAAQVLSGCTAHLPMVSWPQAAVLVPNLPACLLCLCRSADIPHLQPLFLPAFTCTISRPSPLPA